MLVYGKNVARELLLKKTSINKIYLLKDFSDQNILNLINNAKIKPTYIDKNQISKFAMGNHQGIILDIPNKKTVNLEDLIISKPNLIVMLDHLEDPHNVGAIIRTCEAAGVKYIIMPNKRSASTEGIVYKTSAGAINNVELVSVANLRDTLIKLKKEGYWVVGTSMESTNSYHNFEYPEKTILIIGNEGKGISNILMKESDFLVNIPMHGSVNSLNASVAAGIIIFEIINKRE